MFMELEYKYMGRQPMFMDLEQLCCQLPILPKAILDTFPIKFPVSFSTETEKVLKLAGSCRELQTIRQSLVKSTRLEAYLANFKICQRPTKSAWKRCMD